jgi:hypothetical protein
MEDTERIYERHQEIYEKTPRGLAKNTEHYENTYEEHQGPRF